MATGRLVVLLPLRPGNQTPRGNLAVLWPDSGARPGEAALSGSRVRRVPALAAARCPLPSDRLASRDQFAPAVSAPRLPLPVRGPWPVGGRAQGCVVDVAE